MLIHRMPRILPWSKTAIATNLSIKHCLQVQATRAIHQEGQAIPLEVATQEVVSQEVVRQEVATQEAARVAANRQQKERVLWSRTFTSDLKQKRWEAGQQQEKIKMFNPASPYH